MHKIFTVFVFGSECEQTSHRGRCTQGAFQRWKALFWWRLLAMLYVQRVPIASFNYWYSQIITFNNSWIATTTLILFIHTLIRVSGKVVNSRT